MDSDDEAIFDLKRPKRPNAGSNVQSTETTLKAEKNMPKVERVSPEPPKETTEPFQSSVKSQDKEPESLITKSPVLDESKQIVESSASVRSINNIQSSGNSNIKKNHQSLANAQLSEARQ